MAFNISYIYKAVDRFSSTANRMARAANNFTSRVRKSNLEIKKFGRSVRHAGARIAAFVTTSMGLFSFGMLKAAGTMEQMEVSFESMLGSANKAKLLMKDLVSFAAKTPFELVGISKATKQLLAFGIKQKNIVSNLQVLGDISAGAGVPLTDMAAIFGKIKAKGKAMTEEILQLSDRGIPIIDVLAKKFNTTGEAVLDAASKSQLSFKLISNALKGMVSKGGIFHQQMIRQSKTLFGLFSTMKDVMFNAFAVMGDGIIETTNLKEKMVELSQWIEKATAKFNLLSPSAKKMIVYAGLLVAALAPVLLVVGALVLGIGLLLSPIGLAVVGLGLLTAAALKFKPVGDTLRVVFHLGRIAIESMLDSFKKLGGYISSVMPSFEFLDKLTDKMGSFFGGGGITSMEGFADYLSKQTLSAPQSTDINAQNINASINGKILVEATGNSRVVNTQSKTSGMGGNLGINMNSHAMAGGN